MRLIRANQAPPKLVESFLKNNQEIKKSSLLDSGYVVEINNRIMGCFHLEQIDEGLYWLRRLYIIRTDAIKLPVLVEAVLALALQKNATKVFVKSHKLMLDIILKSLQFQSQTEAPVKHLCNKNNGKWWSYNIGQ